MVKLKETNITFEECKQALSKPEGRAFRMQGRKETPQELYEFGFIEHDKYPMFSHTKPKDITLYTRVIFKR